MDGQGILVIRLLLRIGDDGRAVFCLLAGLLISGHCGLCPGVLDFLPVPIPVQSGDRSGPAVARTEHDRLFFLSAVERHGQSARSCGIIRVLPDFLHSQVNRFGFMGILECRDTILRLRIGLFVSLGDFLCPRIDDPISLIDIDRKIRNSGFPSVCLIQFDGIPCAQRCIQGFRTDTVAVVIVIPDLDDRDRGPCNPVRICNGGNRAFRLIPGLFILADRRFGPAVLNLLAVMVLGQVFHSGGPVFRRTDGDHRSI